MARWGTGVDRGAIAASAERARRAAWPVAWASIGMVAIGSIALAFAEDDAGGDLPLAIVSFLGATFFAVIGALIASRTGNRIGWLYLAIIAVEGLAFAVGAYVEVGGGRDLPLTEIARAFADPLFLSGLAMFVAVFLLFPTGGLASPRWRWVWRPYVAAVGATFLGFLLQPGAPAADLAGGTATSARPGANVLGVEALDAIIGPVLAVAGATIIVAAAAGLTSIVVRFRRGSPEERQQIRWLLAVAVLAGIAFVATVASGMLVEQAEAGARAESQALVIANNVALLLLVASVVIGIPLATAVAILRYRLYDLDIVIRKTVVFAILAGFVTLVYAGVVVGLSQLLGGDSLLLSIAATAAVSALFQPVRRWATRFANRLVFGKRSEPYEVLSTFSDRIGATYAAEDVLPRMAHVIADGIGAERTEVWLAKGDAWRLAAAWPADGATLEGNGHRVPIRYRDEELGVSKPATDPLSPPEEKLLRDLASQAGLVLRNVGLTVDLQARVTELAARAEELRTSRARIVEAHDAERRRLERNIHDGAQQHLVALAVKLRLAGSVAAKDPERGAEMLRTLADETEAARAALLDLASGIYPSVLEEHGIGPALEEQARAGGVPVAVETDGLGRLPIETEAAVYFVCLEAMQNAAKYARASRIEVLLGVRDGHLMFEVADDGDGFDTSAAEEGSGLRNMRDRLSAFDGDVRIESAPGRGTAVRGSVPLVVEVRS
jgi:signal transduction histidine kinase